MKITRVSCASLDATYPALWWMARKYIIVIIETDEGIVGFGDATNWPYGCSLPHIVTEVGRSLIGRDPTDVEALWHEMYRATHYVGQAGLAIAALSGLEIALWDITGKSLGVPVYKLLGGAVRERIQTYANYWYLGIPNEPDAYADATAKVLEKGFKAVKFYPLPPATPGDPLRRTLSLPEMRGICSLVKAVRETAGPDVEVYVECGGKLDYYTAQRLMQRLEEYDVGFVEEPIPPENMDTMAKLSARSRIPIASGERLYTSHDFRRLLELQAVAIVQPDIVRTGGLLETKKIAAIAETHFTPVAPHNANTPIGTVAGLHFGASTPNFMTLEYFVEDVPWRDAFMTPSVVVDQDGFVRRPEGPGLGVDVDIEFIRKSAEVLVETK